MEIKTGFKFTDVGVIPNEWEVVPIGDLVTEFRGGASLEPSDFTDSGVKVLPKRGVGRTGWLQIEDSDQKYCSPEYAAVNYRNQVDETFTIVVLRDLVPSGPSIGLMVQIREKETYVLAQGVYGFKVTNAVIPEYLVQLSNTHWYRKLANSIMVGSTQVHITNTAFKLAKIPLPPLPEQRAIAAALSDVDALLAALDALNAKKRLIKQGAMQVLLTPPSAAGQAGQRRLPGFSGEWETKTLEETVDCLDNLRVPLNETQREKMRGNIPYCGANGVLDYVNDYVIDDNIILIAEDGGYFDEYATRPIAYQMSGKCWVNNHAHILKAKDGINQDFVFFSLVHKNILPYLSGGTRAKLNKFEMYKIEIVLPKEENEQTAIAEVLSDMDAEIQALEQRRAKIRLLKQGMMQELLTGRIRLV